MDKNVMIALIVSATILLVAGLGFATMQSIFDGESDVISVDGFSEVAVVPDLVVTYFNIETSGATTKEAKDKNSLIVDSLISNLTSNGFNKDEISTQNFNIYENFDWINGKQISRGFKAVHVLKIELDSEKVEKISQVVDIAADSGASISSISFELSSRLQNEKKAKAMGLAAEDARMKAQAVAEGLDKNLGRLVSVSSNEFGYSPWPVFAARGNVVEDTAMAKELSTNIVIGEQKVSANVNAKFKIR